MNSFATAIPSKTFSSSPGSRTSLSESFTAACFLRKSLIVALGTFLLVILVLSLMGPGRADAAPCDSVLENMVTGSGIRTGDVKSIEYDVSTGALGTGPIRTGWVRLNSCQGYVVNETTEYCMVIQQYSMGGCAVRETDMSEVPNGGA